MKHGIIGWAITLALALALAAGGRPAVAQSAAPLDVARAWFAAYNAHDLVKLRALFDPAARCKAEYADPTMPSEFGVDAFIAETAKTDPADHIIVNGLTWDGADTVGADVAPVFATAPPLAHPATGTVTFKVQSGRVTYWEFRFSAQTRQDIGAAMAASAARSAPGMPRTGIADFQGLAALVILGALCLAAGALIRRAQPRRP